MTKAQSNLFKSLIFLFGIGVIYFAFKIFNTAETLEPNQKFFWINLVVLYAVFFLPLFFNSITLGNVDKKVPSLVGVWSCVLIFELINIPLSIIVLTGKMPVKVAVLSEAVMIFLAAIFIYFSYLANTNINNVQAAEQRSMALITQMRSSLEMLNLKAGGLGMEFADQKKKISSASENARYISPVDTAESISLESQIIGKTAEISSSIDTVMAGSDSKQLNVQLSALEMLINQRKLLRK